MRHHAAVENRAVPDYRGNRGFAGVLRRVKTAFLKNIVKKGYVTLPFQQHFGYIYEYEIPDSRQGPRSMA